MAAIAKVEPLTTARTLRGPFDYRLPAALAGVEVGSLLVVPFGRRRVLGVVVELAAESAIAPERLAAPVHALEQGVPPELVGLAHWIADEYCSTPARALNLVLPPGAGARARRLADREGPPRTRRTQRRRPRHIAVGAPGPARAPELTAAQAAALAPVRDAIVAGRSERLLLHGVTGSGKTEVYLHAAAAALDRGRAAIVMVPEIALTPQIVARFAARFGDTVAVLHSRLTDAERREEWRRLRTGEARVCVGPRSAVFAPVAGLGLVVVDEEHDASYKHEGDPRYDARRVAEHRAAKAGAVLLAGSATPRPESWHALAHLSLPERVDGRPLPPVELVDMRDAAHALHPRTREALERVRRERRKAIVLLNRRGWSNFLSCRSCGRVWECPQCDVALVLHRAAGTVSCHHCGHSEPVVERCGACGSLSVARHGAGTERLEHELGQAFADDPGFPVLRLDSDAATGRDAVSDLLARFDRARSGVLLGTQMVAKGHDFPDVTLGVVLDADATLRFPDFRADERTFAMVAQLAGRAGRGPGGGRVIVQTLAPEAPAIVHAARHDTAGFLAEELARREALRYPPFADLIRVVCASAEPDAASAAAGAIAQHLGSPPGATVLGPAPLFRLRGRERSQLVVKAGDRAAAVRAAGGAVAEVAGDRAHRRVQFSVDVDPQ